ncbi:glycoside hydrolase family 79 protein [Apiospora saccharicola]|uniref:Glycoside hydrolase family 79 protein n=1 Tax=Apiospora saccharicola TaxID=335842 RepID=A0ABR1WD91_9PEZI
MEAHATLSLTLPYNIDFTVTRSGDYRHRPGDPVLVRRSPLIDGLSSSSGLVLLEHTADGGSGGFTRIPVDYSGILKLPEEERITVNSYTQNLGQLLPGENFKLHGTLPEFYQRRLEAGKRYTLLWPGKAVTMWAWGSIQDHPNIEMRANDHDNQKEEPRLILPGGPRITFLTESVAEPPWPQRTRREAEVGFARANLDERDWRSTRWSRLSSPPIQDSERCEGAPHLAMALACDPTVAFGCELARVTDCQGVP